MLSIFAPLFTWLVRAVVVKFILFTALFAVLAVVVPIVIGYITPFLNVQGAFSALTGGVWYWLNFFSVGTGFNMIVSAYITRFMIRRMPVIG